MVKVNKKEIKKVKQHLKNEAVKLRNLKATIKTIARSGEVSQAATLQSLAAEVTMSYRILHVGYCMARGKTYKQVEPNCKNPLNPMDIYYVMNMLIELPDEDINKEEAA